MNNKITKSLRSPRTKVRGLCRLWDASKFLSNGICCTAICNRQQIACAQSAPQPKGCGLWTHFDITKFFLTLLLASLIFLTGCTPIEPTEDEIYAVGRILHNVNNATNTSLTLSQGQFATYKFTKDFPSQAPVLFDEFFYFISPNADIAAAPISTAVSKFTKTFYAYGNDSAIVKYPRAFSLYNGARITYFNYSGYEEENLSLSGLEATSINPFYSIAPIPGENKEFVFGGPYLPGSVFFDNQRLIIMGELLTSNKTVISLKTDFVPEGTELPNYTISVNGAVVESNNLIGGGGSWDKYILNYYPSINGQHEIVLNLPSYYPLFKKSTVTANFVYAGQPVDIPWLSGIEIPKRFALGSTVPIFVEASSLSNFSAINVSYKNASGGWTQISLVFGALSTSNASFCSGGSGICRISAQGSIPSINQPLDILINLSTPGASQSYVLESVSFPEELLTAIVSFEPSTISPGTLVRVSGSVKDPLNKGVGNLLIMTFMNGQEIQKSFTFSQRQGIQNTNIGNFSFTFDAPLGLTNGSNLSFRFGEAGVYPERTINLLGAGQVFGYDLAVLGLGYPIPLVIGVNNSISVNVSNVGTNSTSGILEVYYAESNSSGFEWGQRILVGARPVSLLSGETRIENFNSMFNEENYNLNYVNLIAKINVTNGTDQNNYNNERTVVRPIFVDRDAVIFIYDIDPFVVNESSNITLRIENRGFEALANLSYQIEYRLDIPGENFTIWNSGVLESLAPSSFEEMEIGLTLNEIDTYEIRAILNVTDDRLILNNIASIFVSPMLRGADLSAFVNAPNLIEGVESQFQVSVSNRGVEEAQNPEIEIYYQEGYCSLIYSQYEPPCDNLTLISGGQLPPIASFSSVNYDFNFTPVNHGMITMVFILNATNEIMSDDNIREFNIIVSESGPDVLVWDLFTDSQNFVVNISSNVSAIIKNIGNIEAVQVGGEISWANIYLGVPSVSGVPSVFNILTSANLGVVGPLQEKIMSSLFTPPVKGRLTLRVNVSDENDTNPYNNELMREISVFNTGPDVGVTSINANEIIVGQSNWVNVGLTSYWNESSENIIVSLFENNTLIDTQVISISGGIGGNLGGYLGMDFVSFSYTPQSAGEKELRVAANFFGDIDLYDNTLSNNFTAYNLVNVTFNATNSSGSPSEVFLISELEWVYTNYTPVTLSLLEGRPFGLVKGPIFNLNEFQDYEYLLIFDNVSLNASESIITDYYENLSDDGVNYHSALVNRPSFSFEANGVELVMFRDYASSIGIFNTVLNLQKFSSCDVFDFSSKSCNVPWEEEETLVEPYETSIRFDLKNLLDNEFEGLALSTSNETLIFWPYIENLFDTIFFFNNIDFSRIISNVSLQQYIVLEHARISVDTEVLPELDDEPARLTFKNIQFVNPLVTYNGSICPSNVCSNINYDSQNDTFGVTVTGFSEFGVVEGPYCGDNICQASAAESCSSCVADCGSCPGPGGGPGSGGGPGGGVTCTPKWDCNWGPCSENSQKFICVDKKGCGNRINKPRESSRLCFSGGNCVDNDNDGYGAGIDCLGLDLDDTDPGINIIVDDSDQTEPKGVELGIVFWITTVVLLAMVLVVMVILLKTMKNRKTLDSLKSISSSPERKSSESWPVESS